MDVCSRSHQKAHEPHGVFDVFFAKDTLSAPGPTLRTANDVKGTGQHQGHDLVQSRASLLVIQAFQLIEISILDLAILSRGYI